MALNDEKNYKILKIQENKFYYTPVDFIHISNTNFPPEKFGFSSGRPRYWRIEVLNFENENCIIEAKVLDYDYDQIEEFDSHEKKSNLNGFKFSNLSWARLKTCLTHYSKNSFEVIREDFEDTSTDDNFIINENQEDGALEEGFFDEEYDSETKEEELNQETNTTEKYEIQKSFLEDFANITFKKGYVHFKRSFPDITSEIYIEIKNEYLIENYNYIKNYFTKINGSSKFNVELTLMVEDNFITEVSATSKEIEAINEDFILKVKDARALNITNIKSEIDEDINIYTIDELLAKLDETENLFQQTEEEIINLITESNSVRNKEQLLYLSGLQDENIKIKFTVDKNFGYLFSIKNQYKIVICWELLHSNATYLWSFNKEVKFDDINERMERTIKTIQVNGRQNYRSANKRKDIDEDLNFYLINHSKQNSNKKDCFGLWKKKLENYLSNTN